MSGRPALSRPLPVGRIPSAGFEVAVDPTEAEREALAAELGLPSLQALSAVYRVTGTADAVRVVGRVRATVEQVCVVSLEPFESTLDEEVSLDFESAERAAAREAPAADGDLDRDLPDEIAGGAIDLGLVTQEFLALGLDPYPRKPGIAFEGPAADSAGMSPFAALAGWTGADD